ncbi:L,D-transpeptidase family protein [Roseitalea porphyridii]|uniref:L,D-transpeptidase family protein n=1 Tax=Roseitalea porphyridii TaxID=1852022 RepID=UPI001FCE80C4|nr:L,D-transpeptidase family protein [Roseitalea porphyridii]
MALTAAPNALSRQVYKDATELQPGEFTWEPDLSPSGAVAVIVSLPEQLVHVYRNGVRIAVSTCSTGKPGHSTPTGVFTVLQKDADHRSSTYNNTPMPNMNRLTWSSRSSTPPTAPSPSTSSSASSDGAAPSGVHHGEEGANMTRLLVAPVAWAGVLVALPAAAQDETAQAVGMAVGGIIGIVLMIVIGAVVGWLASMIVKGSGSGLIGDILFGIGGSILAGYLLPLMGISIGGAFGSFLAALLGAVILIVIVRLIRKAAA